MDFISLACGTHGYPGGDANRLITPIADMQIDLYNAAQWQQYTKSSERDTGAANSPSLSLRANVNRTVGSTYSRVGHSATRSRKHNCGI